MFTIEMLPARQGDCLWIEYGKAEQPHVVLIDGGMGETAAHIEAKVEDLKQRTGRARIELLIVTHIDNDHILGINALLKRPDLGLELGDVWFNGRPQLEAAFRDVLGIAAGDVLSQLLKSGKHPWNAAFSGGLVQMPEGSPPKRVTIEGLSLSVIGPPPRRLHRLAEEWLTVESGDEDQKKAGADDILGRNDKWPAAWMDDAKEDNAVANGSSIVVVADYEGRRALLCGDAFPTDVVEGLKAYRAANGGGQAAVKLDATKLAHHGSARNVSKDLFELIDCENFLVSTDGTTFAHPDIQALLRVVAWSRRRVKLHFNYANERTLWWIERAGELETKFQKYDASAPPPGSRGVRIDL